jgi:TatD DNase family protein
LIDSHAHLDSEHSPIGPIGLITRAREAGVRGIVAIGTGLDSSERALAIADSFPGVVAALGIHPHDAAGEDASRLDELRTLLAHPKAVAIGEIGLDYFRDYAPHDAQQALFRAQLELASELGLPVAIHTRAADDDTAALLASFDGTVVLHCFSSPGLLAVALERDYYVSFAGNATYKNASDLRLAATQVPAERILAETDTPYLAPQPVRGKPNEPAYVMHTLAALAEVRGDDVSELERQIEENAARVFGPALLP